MCTTPPKWVKDAIFYQIFPDRFSRYDNPTSYSAIRFKRWGSPPENQGFQGGNLYGIVDKLPYIRELGVNALYLTPVFASASNHRYHAYDYYTIDPILGGNDAFICLLDKVHSLNMHIILDGVFNHAGRGFWAFHHILENGGDSPYRDWFDINGWPLYAYDDTGSHDANYGCWAGNRALPKFNMNNPAVRQYIMEVIRYWMDLGIDGWRMDAPHEIERLDFWEEACKTVKSSNENAYLCGEYWFIGDKFRRDRYFDGLTNYPFSVASLGLFARNTLREDFRVGPFRYTKLTVENFSKVIREIYTVYPWENCCANMNILDSHDTGRALWTSGYDESALRLAVLFQMTMPGTPCIYYGDEIGLNGGPEPQCREAFPWGNTRIWNLDLLAFYKKVTALRSKYNVLRRGDFHQLYAKNDIFAFSRTHAKEVSIVALNANDSEARFKIPLTLIPAGFTEFKNIWDERDTLTLDPEFMVIRIPARSGAVYLANTSYREDGSDLRSNNQ